MDRNTGNPGDQYRPRTPGEEGILRIYEDGINQSSDMMERSGGLRITERIPPLQDPPVLTPVRVVNSDPELDVLPKESPDIWEPSAQSPSSIRQEVRLEADKWRTAVQDTRIEANALQEILEDMLPWL